MFSITFEVVTMPCSISSRGRRQPSWLARATGGRRLGFAPRSPRHEESNTHLSKKYLGHRGVVWRLRQNWNIPHCVDEVWTASLCKELWFRWNRRLPHGINVETFRDDGKVEEVFTSTTVRTRDTVFPLFGDAGTKSATLRRPNVEPEEAEGNLAPGEELHDGRGQEKPDPFFLQCAVQHAMSMFFVFTQIIRSLCSRL